MTVGELILLLHHFDLDAEVAVYADGTGYQLHPEAFGVRYDPETESTTVEIIVI